ncbi:MAG: hypothetical protein ACLPN2_00230 [Terriglobales bacterium]
MQKIVNAIHASSVWNKGKNASGLIWDENDYSVQPLINQVVAIIDTKYGFHQLTSNVFYDHFRCFARWRAASNCPVSTMPAMQTLKR